MATGSKMFKLDMANWTKKVGLHAEALARQSIFNLCESVVSDTKVDTGNLRGNWQPSLGAPVTNEIDAARGVIDIGGVIQGMKIGDHFFMVNNAAYALRIEFGFVGTDSLGRKYNQKGDYNVTTNLKRWPEHVARAASELGL